jgi:hypothetical protein
MKKKDEFDCGMIQEIDFKRIIRLVGARIREEDFKILIANDRELSQVMGGRINYKVFYNKYIKDIE